MAQMQVFVSHSHEDDAFCRGIVAALRGAGADVWYDEHNLGSGQLVNTIERELRARPVMVVILSDAALRSPWVREECTWGYSLLRRDPSRIILPITAGQLEEDAIWLFLSTFKRIEAPPSEAVPIERGGRAAAACAGANGSRHVAYCADTKTNREHRRVARPRERADSTEEIR